MKKDTVVIADDYLHGHISRICEFIDSDWCNTYQDTCGQHPCSVFGGDSYEFILVCVPKKRV